MSFNTLQFEDLISRTLVMLEDQIPVSDSALFLLAGTAAQESGFGTYLRQLDMGPAIGVFQMEPATHDDIWDNFIQFRRDLQKVVTDATPHMSEYKAITMEFDLRYAIIMARIHYYRVPDPLPAWHDVDALAAYWKEHYNTHEGAGTVSEFVENYEKYVRT